MTFRGYLAYYSINSHYSHGCYQDMYWNELIGRVLQYNIHVIHTNECCTLQSYYNEIKPTLIQITRSQYFSVSTNIPSLLVEAARLIAINLSILRFITS